MFRLLIPLLTLAAPLLLLAEAQDPPTLSFVFGPGAVTVVRATLCTELAAVGVSLDSRYDNFRVFEDKDGDVTLTTLQDATLLAEYFCMDVSASEDCDPVSSKAILTAVSESPEGGFVMVFSRSMPDDGTDYMQSVVLAGNRDVKVAVVHVPGCAAAMGSSAVLQLLAGHTSQQLFLPASTPADLPAILHHQLNVTGRQRLATLASAMVTAGSTTGVRIVVSPADAEMLVSVVCEDGRTPQIQTSIRSPTDRANFKVAGAATVYLARLRSPTPTQYAVYVRAVSTCRLIVTALTDVERVAPRFAEQADLGENGVPTQSSLHPVPGGRSFIILPTIPSLAVERVEIVLPDGSSRRSAQSRRAAFSNESLMVLGPISFPQKGFRLLIRGEIGRSQIRHQSRVFLPVDHTAEAMAVVVPNTCSSLELTCPGSSASSETLWTVNGRPVTSGNRIQVNRTHLTISPLLLSENGRVSCFAIPASQSEDITAAHYDVTTEGSPMPGTCAVCTALHCPFPSAAWLVNNGQQGWSPVQGADLLMPDNGLTLQWCGAALNRRTGQFRCQLGARRQSFTVLSADYVLLGTVPVDVFQNLQSHGVAETPATTEHVDVDRPPTRASAATRRPEEPTTAVAQPVPYTTTTTAAAATQPPPPPPPSATQGPETTRQPSPQVSTVLAMETTADGGLFARTTCQPLKVPENGMISYEETATSPVQVVARLLCDPGHRAAGERETVCIRDLAQWAIPIGRCQPQAPPQEVTTQPTTTPPPPPEVTTQPATTPPPPEVTTQPPTTPPPPPTRPPTTPPATTPAATTRPATTQPAPTIGCQPLPQPQHGVITEVKLSNGVTMARLRCNSGARVTGTQFVICAPGVVHRWNRAIGSCALPGDRVTTPAPTPEATTSPATTAAPSGCPEVAQVSNGMVTVTSPFPDLRVARLSCHIGTTLRGSNQVICRSDGHWNGRLGECSLPVATTAGVTTTETTTTAPATTLPDISTTPSPTEPEGPMAPCGRLARPANGVAPLRRVNAIIFLARLTCDVGYRATGLQQILCLTGEGSWRGQLGSCQPAVRLITTMPLPPPPTTMPTAAAPITTPTTAAPTTSPAAPPRCPPAPRVANGIISRQIMADGLIVAHLTCLTGYLAEGSRQRVCRPRDGVWLGSLGSCVPPATTPPREVTPVTPAPAGDCPRTPSVANGHYVPRPGGGTLTFGRLICDAGSERRGPENIFCRPGEGVWRGVLARCVQPGAPTTVLPPTTVPAATTEAAAPTSCRSRGRLVNGRVSFVPARTLLIATYSCNPGYNLLGGRTAVCINLQWNRPLPSCVSPGNPVTRPPPTPEATSSSCPDLTQVPNGMLTVSAPFPDLRVARLSCHVGSTLRGSDQLTCRMNGRWNGQLGECIVPVTVPPPTDSCAPQVLTSLIEEVTGLERRMQNSTRENTELRALIATAQRRLTGTFVGEAAVRVLRERVSTLTAQGAENGNLLSGCKRRIAIIESAFDGECPA